MIDNAEPTQRETERALDRDAKRGSNDAAYLLRYVRRTGSTEERMRRSREAVRRWQERERDR